MRKKIRKVSFGNPILDVRHEKYGIIKIKNVEEPENWPSNITQKLIYWTEKKPNQN